MLAESEGMRVCLGGVIPRRRMVDRTMSVGGSEKRFWQVEEVEPTWSTAPESTNCVDMRKKKKRVKFNLSPGVQRHDAINHDDWKSALSSVSSQHLDKAREREQMKRRDARRWTNSCISIESTPFQRHDSADEYEWFLDQKLRIKVSVVH